MPGELLRKASPTAKKPSNSTRQCQLAISALSAGVMPNKGGSGKRASKYAAMAALSVSSKPSSVCSAGTVQCGLMTRKASLICSLLRKSTCTVSWAMPFSASMMRARRGLGAVLQSYKVIMGFTFLFGL